MGNTALGAIETTSHNLFLNLKTMATKCLTCRKSEMESTTWWERMKSRMFHLFHEELLDYGQEKFTQGFGDGYKKGREEMQQKLNESQEFWTKYNEQMQPLKLDWQVDLHEVLDLRKDAKGIPHFFIGGKKVEG